MIFIPHFAFRLVKMLNLLWNSLYHCPPPRLQLQIQQCLGHGYSARAMNSRFRWQAEHQGALGDAGSTQNTLWELLSPNIIRFFQEKLGSGETLLLFEEETTHLRRSHYLQVSSTYLGIGKDTKGVIISTCNDFAMWCTHSTELKTKLCEYLSCTLYQNTCFNMLHTGGIRVLGSKDLHLTLEWEQIW